MSLQSQICPESVTPTKVNSPFRITSVVSLSSPSPGIQSYNMSPHQANTQPSSINKQSPQAVVGENLQSIEGDIHDMGALTQVPSKVSQFNQNSQNYPTISPSAEPLDDDIQNMGALTQVPPTETQPDLNDSFNDSRHSLLSLAALNGGSRSAINRLTVKPNSSQPLLGQEIVPSSDIDSFTSTNPLSWQEGISYSDMDSDTTVSENMHKLSPKKSQKKSPKKSPRNPVNLREKSDINSKPGSVDDLHSDPESNVPKQSPKIVLDKSGKSNQDIGNDSVRDRIADCTDGGGESVQTDAHSEAESDISEVLIPLVNENKKCDFCHESFETMKQFKKHKCNRNITCDRCRMTFQTTKIMKRHKQRNACRPARLDLSATPPPPPAVLSPIDLPSPVLASPFKVPTHPAPKSPRKTISQGQGHSPAKLGQSESQCPGTSGQVQSHSSAKTSPSHAKITSLAKVLDFDSESLEYGSQVIPSSQESAQSRGKTPSKTSKTSNNLAPESPNENETQRKVLMSPSQALGLLSPNSENRSRTPLKICVSETPSLEALSQDSPKLSEKDRGKNSDSSLDGETVPRKRKRGRKTFELVSQESENKMEKPSEILASDSLPLEPLGPDSPNHSDVEEGKDGGSGMGDMSSPGKGNGRTAERTGSESPREASQIITSIPDTQQVWVVNILDTFQPLQICLIFYCLLGLFKLDSPQWTACLANGCINN